MDLITEERIVKKLKKKSNIVRIVKICEISEISKYFYRRSTWL